MTKTLKDTKLDKLIDAPMRKMIDACRYRDLFIKNRVAAENKIRNLAVSLTVRAGLGEITYETIKGKQVKVFPKADPSCQTEAEEILKGELNSIEFYKLQIREKESIMIDSLKAVRSHMPNLNKLIERTVGVSEIMFAIILGQCGTRPEDASEHVPAFANLPANARVPRYTPARFVNHYALRSRFGLACKSSPSANDDGSRVWMSQSRAMFVFNSKEIKELNDGKGWNVGYNSTRRKTMWFVGSNTVKSPGGVNKRGVVMPRATYRDVYESKRARLEAAVAAKLGRTPKASELKGQHSRAMVEVAVVFLRDIWDACHADYKAAGSTI